MLKDWKLITSAQDLEGKTIFKVVEYYDDIYISFTDKSYCSFEIYEGCLGMAYTTLDHTDSVIYALGMATREEIAEKERLDKIRLEEAKQNTRIRELKQLAELKAKYPDA